MLRCCGSAVLRSCGSHAAVLPCRCIYGIEFECAQVPSFFLGVPGVLGVLGVWWLVLRQVKGGRVGPEELEQGFKDAASDISGKAKEVQEGAGNALHDVSEKIKEATGQATDSAQDTVDSARGKARGPLEAVRGEG